MIAAKSIGFGYAVLNTYKRTSEQTYAVVKL